MAKQFKIGSPISELLLCEQYATRKDHNTGDSKDDSTAMFAVKELGRTPGANDKNADQRYVTVTIGHRLHANLNDPNDRNQDAEVPKPSGKQPRLLSPTKLRNGFALRFCNVNSNRANGQ